ncbi:DNA-binding transcriptional response regulator, NtrC family, contains REC, AAA-type ATPase, and a Fis-type DNA-binding domains [Gulbenkiania indica]|uniref:DNA-binding transcriptional response regulator, NtrC family, contains REC, AAA-type ATPase, and a Fis-type DNA-binding domains n=1 Tax=Gulbenkiania indica TaxID=375574 RepID=A0A0K6GWY1_9NEIS|nr:sigma-54 dependent transcriptional regulator [Gulbenkiania indica]CUA83109.1 DNA-binding transcriptional response regulator, NtrC family, contains REC, AAA-type ATPase, and a Fis-type DNA-binding domains [Gulbenkiania indica]
MKRTASQRVLVVDDEADIRELLDLTLTRMGLVVTTAGSVAEALAALDGAGPFDLALTDMRLPDGEGLAVVEAITRRNLDLPVAVITAHGSTENAVAAMKAGAFDYLQKPVSLAHLRALVGGVLRVERPARTEGGARLYGESPAMLEIRALIERVARTQAPVYIRGESGTGKEQAARLIHASGPRAAGPFVPVNCGAIPDSLMESEFFGTRRGAFTGADRDREGFFQQASGGTLFLDEVADLPLSMQVKLLRALQEKKVRRLGATSEEATDVRILCATHKDLAAQVSGGAFRQDLYYRLNVISLTMPPLRELREDLPRFVDMLLERYGVSGPRPRLTPAALQLLLGYNYPGNFRELENIIERAVALATGPEIGPDALQLLPVEDDVPSPPALAGGESLQDYLDRVEREVLLKALDTTRYNRTQAAKRLGISFRSLRYRLERLGIK